MRESILPEPANPKNPGHERCADDPAYLLVKACLVALTRDLPPFVGGIPKVQYLEMIRSNLVGEMNRIASAKASARARSKERSKGVFNEFLAEVRSHQAAMRFCQTWQNAGGPTR